MRFETNREIAQESEGSMRRMNRQKHPKSWTRENTGARVGVGGGKERGLESGVMHDDVLQDFLWKSHGTIAKGWLLTVSKRDFVYITMPLTSDPHP